MPKQVSRAILKNFLINMLLRAFYFYYLLSFRLEFGTAAQPPATPQAGAEKPLSPTGDRREYEFLIECLNK